MTPDWTERFAIAQELLLMDGVVANAAVLPRWIDGDRFWYTKTTQGQPEWLIADARTGERRLAFSLPRLREQLERLADVRLAAEFAPNHVQIQAQGGAVEFNALGRRWRYTEDTGELLECGRIDRGWLWNRQGSEALAERDGNLWIVSRSGQERQLTHDGVADNAYACLPMCRRSGAKMLGKKPQAVWSPDGCWILTAQTDERHVPPLPMVDFMSASAHAAVDPNRTALPCDARVTEYRMLLIETATGRQLEMPYRRLCSVRMNDTPFSMGLCWWSGDGRRAFFVDVERYERSAHVVEFDVSTSTTRVVFSDSAPDYLELTPQIYDRALVHPLESRDEIIWYSERDGRGHLYLYDLQTGALLRQLTSGPWQVRELCAVDEARREALILAGGIAGDEDPYFRKPCSVDLDTAVVRMLSSAPGDHTIWSAGEFELSAEGAAGEDIDAISGVSPQGEHFVTVIGLPDRLGRSMLLHRDGTVVCELETAVSPRLPAQWKWPKPVKLKAADGLTDVHGLLFEPLCPASDDKAPIIDYIYGGPQMAFAPKTVGVKTMDTMVYGTASAFSALGAFCLVLDGRGTALREKSFRVASHGAAQTASNLEDHISAIRQLAVADPRIDTGRVGIAGYSGGGYASVLAALRHGDFFKVSVAGGGNYDLSLFWHGWGDRYHGPWSAEHYVSQAAKTYASGMSGKLMLIHGLRDAWCVPAALFQLVDALIEADKSPDLVILPSAGHEMTGYAERRRLEYFVQHLFGEVPPPPVKWQATMDPLKRRIVANLRPAAAP
jgi:dipeptidyl aminopeptidase/acylaminoacyl peptidase